MQAATVNGKVTKQGSDTAVAEATVILRQGNQGRDTVVTDTAGAFSFTDVAVGNYTVIASKAGFLNSASSQANAGTADTTISLANISLSPIPAPGKVAGVVRQLPDSALVAGARVIIRRTSSTSFADTVETAADGAYSFDSVPVNTNYVVVVSDSGFTTSTTNGVNVLTAATTTLNVFLAPVGLPGKVAGVVRKSADSTVLAGATVIIRRTTGTGFSDTLVSDAEGKFGWDSVPAASYTLATSATGYVTGNSNVTVTGGVTATPTVYLAVPPSPGKITGVVRKMPDSSVVAGATVIIRRNNGGTFADTVITGATGAFSFDSVTATTYTLTASATGLVTRTINNVTVGSGATVTPIVVMAVPAAPGKVAGVVKKMPDSSVAVGAMVILRRQNAGFADTATSGADGSYTFNDITVASGYSIVVSLAGYLTSTTNNIAVDTAKTTTANIVIEPIPAPGKVAGVVKKLPDSSVVAGATVVLRRSGQGGSVDTAVTGANGAYSFDTVAVGTGYSITVSATGLTTGTTNGLAVTTGATTTANVVLAPPTVGTLIVYVGLDSATNPAISGVALVATSGGRQMTGITNASGYATFEKVITGNYSVTATLAGYVAKGGSRAVTEDGLDTLRINLARATDSNTKALTGIVKGADSAAIAGVIVSFRTNGASAITLLDTTNASGEFSFSGFASTVNNGTLTLSKDGYVTQTVNNVSLTAATNARNVVLQKSPASLRRALAAKRNGLQVQARQPGLFLLPGGQGRLDIMGRRSKLPL